MWKNGLRKADFGLRGGYGSLRKPIFYSALCARAYGPHLSWQGFLDRRWLFTSDLKVYSRPYVYLYPRMRVIVYSRPRAESGWKRSVLPGKTPLLICLFRQLCPALTSPKCGEVAERSEVGGDVKHLQVGISPMIHDFWVRCKAHMGLTDETNFVKLSKYDRQR